MSWIGRWKVPEGVKITNVAYVAFLKEHLEPWFKSKHLSLKRKTIFMHGNARHMQRRQRVPTYRRRQRVPPIEDRFKKWSSSWSGLHFRRIWTPSKTCGASLRGRYMFLDGNFQLKRSYGVPYPQLRTTFIQKKFRNLQIRWISAWYPSFEIMVDTFIFNNKSKIMYQILFIWMKNCYKFILLS